MKRILWNLWRMIYPVITYFAVSILVEFICIFIYAWSQGGAGQQGVLITQELLIEFINSNTLVITLILNLALIPVMGFFMYRDMKKGLVFEGKKFPLPQWSEFILIAVLGMAAAIGVNGLVSISGIASLDPAYQEVSQVIYSGSVPLEILSAAIAAPIVEELFFRGLIFKRLRSMLSPKVSIIISAVVFGAFHGNMVQFIYAFIIGNLLAYVYEKYKTIAMPITLHIGANFISVVITEFLPERYMTVMTVLTATAVTLGISGIIIKFISKYQVEAI